MELGKPGETPKTETGSPTDLREGGINPDKLIEPGSFEMAVTPMEADANPDRLITARRADVDPSAEGRVFKDDNDEVYRVGDNLLPNKAYEIDGYTYKTDSRGRLASAEGKLQLKNHEGYNQMRDRAAIDRLDKKDVDDRGHLLGDQFNGRGGLENVVPMDANLNRGDYKNLENDLAKAVRAGCDVRLKVEPRYEKGSSRPVGFKATSYIDGEKSVRYFDNSPSGGSNGK